MKANPPSALSHRHARTVKPFRLVKYFAAASLAVILTATILLSFFFVQRDVTVLLNRNEEFALLLAENLNHQVFQKFVMPTALLYGKMSLREPRQYNQLDTVVQTTIYGLNVERVVIYSNDDLMVYSTENTIEQMLERSQRNDPFGLAIEPTREYRLALHGVPTSVLKSYEPLYHLFTPGRGDRMKLLSTYAPFRVDLMLESKAEDVIGVLEITQNVTGGYRSIIKAQTLNISIFAGVMVLLFISLLIIVRRAEQILNRRAHEKKRLEEQLNQAERLAALGQMIAGVSHEIRNPLGIIQSTGELLAQRMKKYEPASQLATVIVEESARLNRIVTEFLDFARPQVPRMVRCDVGGVIHHILQILEPEFRKSRIQVDTAPMENLPPIPADPDLLYRGLLNVFNNSIQAMPEGGVLQVGLSNGAEHGVGVQRILIEDTGDGIPDEVLGKVMTPFVTTREKGTGLGLSIVHNIIEAHGGWIHIESPVKSELNVSMDRGTRVTISLPVSQVSEAAEDRE